MVYAGFWRRFSAYLLDVIIILPLIVVVYFGGEKIRLFQLYYFLPNILFSLWFHIYLVKRYGGTPGKLIMGTRITMVDGSPITLKAAILRYSVLGILSWLLSAAMIIPSLQMTDEIYYSLDYMERTKKIVEMVPPWHTYVNIMLQIWVWSEFISILFNKKRRAIHDFIAGTVVIRTENKVANLESKQDD